MSKIGISNRSRIVAAAAVILAAAAATTFATFTDDGQVGTQFTSGTLDLKFDNDQDGRPTPYQVDFSAGFDRLAPGDTVTRDLAVFNSGNIDAEIDMSTTVTNSVPGAAEQLQDKLQIKIVDSGTGSELYNGPLAGASFSDLNIGANGTQASADDLQMSVTLPATATTAVAGQSLDVVLQFNAAQA